MGLKGDSGDWGVQSYQALSRVQGEAGYACEGRHGGCMVCMGQIHQDPWDMHALITMKHHATPAIMHGDHGEPSHQWVCPHIRFRAPMGHQW